MSIHPGRGGSNSERLSLRHGTKSPIKMGGRGSPVLQRHGRKIRDVNKWQRDIFARFPARLTTTAAAVYSVTCKSPAEFQLNFKTPLHSPRFSSPLVEHSSFLSSCILISVLILFSARENCESFTGVLLPSLLWIVSYPDRVV